MSWTDVFHKSVSGVPTVPTNKNECRNLKDSVAVMSSDSSDSSDHKTRHRKVSDVSIIRPTCPTNKNECRAENNVAAVSPSDMSDTSDTKTLHGKVSEKTNEGQKLWKCYAVCSYFHYTESYEAGICEVDGGEVEILKGCKWGYVRYGKREKKSWKQGSFGTLVA
jgi:hypothetical protein